MHMNTLGVFSQPSYITINDEYDKKKPVTATRHGGKQFLTSPPKKGKVGKGTCFDEFKPLFQGDQYVDPGHHEREYAKKQKAKMIDKVPFRPSSPAKKSTGLGGYYGCIGQPPKHMTEYDVVKKGEKPPPRTPQPKNILTSPPKKGTYGFPGLTIGPPFPYMDSPYDAQREKDLKEREKRLQRRISDKPFKSMSHSLDFFDSHKNVAASKIYTVDPSKLPPPKPPKETPKPKITVPFKPSSPAKSGYQGTFSKFPEYKSDPYVTSPAKSPKDSETKARGIFRPTSGPKSTPTKSILFKSHSQLL